MIPKSKKPKKKDENHFRLSSTLIKSFIFLYKSRERLIRTHHVILNYTLFHIKTKQQTNKLDTSKIILSRKRDRLCGRGADRWTVKMQITLFENVKELQSSASRISRNQRRWICPTWPTASTHTPTWQVQSVSDSKRSHKPTFEMSPPTPERWSQCGSLTGA